MIVQIVQEEYNLSLLRLREPHMYIRQFCVGVQTYHRHMIKITHTCVTKINFPPSRATFLTLQIKSKYMSKTWDTDSCSYGFAGFMNIDIHQ